MRKLLCFVLLLFLYVGQLAAAGTPPVTLPPDGGGLVFRENRGQIKDTKGSPRPDVLYTAEANGVQLFFQKNRVSYVYPKYEERKSLSGKMTLQATELYRMDWELIGANPYVVVRSESVSATAGVNNYIYKHCPQGILGVKAYEKIVYENIYPNIDLVFYTASQRESKAFKYDFVVKPGGKVSDIKVRYSAHESLKANADGSLNVTNPYGRLDEKAPYSYQGKNQVGSKFIVNGDVVSFEVSRYDNTQNLVIDPLTVVWGTYYGGTRNENCNALTIDAQNNPIFVGSTKSTDFPVNIGKQTLTNDYADLYVVKFNSAGARQWGTYYGGSDDDEAYDVHTAANGNVVVTGASGTIVGPLPEGDFPTTPTASQPTFGGGRLDAIMLYMTPLGAPVWASYLGGGTGGAPNSTQEGEDQGRGVVVNAQGEIIMVGFTICTDFPTASGGSVNYTNNSGGYDAIITKWNPTNGQVIWSTYYGSTLDDAAEGIDIDQNGNFYITGYTKSASFPVVGAAHQSTCNSCVNNLEDAFVLKFNSNTSLAWGSFYGGSIDDRGRGVSVSRDGSTLYIIGSTNSNNNISTPNSFQPNYALATDAFIVQFNGATGQRNWASYLGDASTDNGMAITQDGNRNAYAVGFTGSASFPTKFALQGTKGGGTDGFLTVINANGRSTRYSTFYGGDRADRANGVAVDNTGAIYVSGETQSTNLQQSAPIFQNTNRGGQEAYVVKLNCNPIPFQVTAQGLNAVCANAGCIALNTNPAGVRFFGRGVQQGNAGEPDRFCPNLVNNVPGTYTIKGYLADACNDSVDVTITIIAVPTATVTGIPLGTICQGAAPFPLNVTLSSGTATSVTFSGPGIEGNNFFNPRNAGTFEVSAEVVTSQGCTLTVKATITVNPNPTPTISIAPNADLCELSATGIPINLNLPGGVLTPIPGVVGTSFFPNQAGGPGVKRLTYTVTQNGCTGTATLDVTVTPAQNATITIANAPPNNTFCILDGNSYAVSTNVPGGTVLLNGQATTAIIPRNLPAGTHTLTLNIPQGLCFRTTTSTITITPSVPSSITVTQNNICETQTTPVSVFVNPAGTLTGAGLNITGSGNNWTINPPFTSGSFTLRLVPNAGTCAQETTVTFSPTPAPTAVITGITPGQSFCAGDNRSYPLTATAGGNNITNQGSWSVNGTPIGASFIPSQFGNPCPNNLTITFTPNQGVCARSATLPVSIVCQVQSTITGITNGQTFCNTNCTGVNLVGSPAGGTWSVLPSLPNFNGSFIPCSTAVGSYTVTYTPAQTECALPATVSFIITQAQRSFISGVNQGQSFCSTDTRSYPLTGTPPGGTFSGTGVNNNTFTPSATGVQQGSQTFTILYTPANTVCALPESLTVTVAAPVNTTITATPAGPYCTTSNNPINFTVNPSVDALNQPISGTWSASPGGLNINTVNGQISAPFTAGTYTITFTPSGCARPSTTTITISESPTAVISINPVGPYCITDNVAKTLTVSGGILGTFSGPGVAGNQFTPAFAGVGTHTITFTPTSGTCFRAGTLSVTVNNLTPSSISGVTNGQTFCELNCATITLDGTPAGGTWSTLPNISNFNGTFQPCSLSQSGSYTFTYTPPASACSSPSSVSIVRIPAQNSFISGIFEGQNFCVTTTTPVPLTGIPTGGTFSGPGVVGNQFTPSVAGVGRHCITYTPGSDVCAKPVTVCVNVNQPEPSRITSPADNAQFCKTDNRTVNLTATPSGKGEQFYINNNFIGSSFIPSTLPVGQHTIEVRYPESACVASSSIRINISDAPTPTITGVAQGQVFCITDGNSYPLATNPVIEGTFTGPGVNNNAFRPSVAGIGTHTIQWTPAQNACGLPTSVTVRVDNQTQSQILGVNNGQTFCNVVCNTITLTANPIGGTWSINPPNANFNNGTFNPCSLQVGSSTITYTPAGTACALPSSVTISILDAPATTIAGVIVGQSFCSTDQVCYPLSVAPAVNGTFSGQGVVGNQFCPRGLSGEITITFTPAQGECAKSSTVRVRVADEIQAIIGGLPANPVCSTTPCFNITGSPTGGQFFFNGVPGGTQFCPAQFAGQSPVTVRYVPPQGSCARETSGTIVITPAQPSSITLSPNQGTNICTTSTFTVTGSPAGGSFTIEGQPLAGNPATINAAQYGTGNKTIIYRGTNGACEYAETLTVTLNAPPNPQIGGLQAFPYCPTVNVCTPMFGTPSGGTFSGPGVTGNCFFPSQAGTGTHQICYKGVFRGCAYETCTTVTVRSAVKAQLFGMAKEYCIEDTNLYTFTATPPGGTFTGEGLNQVAKTAVARFRPRNSTFQPGLVKVTYFGEFDGCPYYVDTLINILPSTPSSINPPTSTFCVSDNNEYDFSVAPLGGRIVGQGVVNNKFNPSRAGVGFWRIDYIPQVGVGCNAPSFTFVTVAPSFLDLTLTLVGQNTIRAFATGNVVKYTLDGVDQGTSNIFANVAPGTHTICATDDVGCTVCETITIGAQTCDCPTNIRATRVGITSARIEWTANTSAQSYRIEYRPTGTTNFLTQTTSATSIDLNSLQSSTEYEVRVISICNGRESQPCTIPINTLDCKAPDFFQARQVNVNDGTVEWALIIGALGYEVQIKENSEPESAYRPVPPAQKVGAADTTHTFTGLRSAVDYITRVRTICGDGEFSPWVYTFFTTLECENTSNIEIREVSCSTAVVRWDAVPQALGYVISYRTVPSGVPTSVRLGAVTEYIITGLNASTSYQATIATICPTGEGVTSFVTSPIFTTEACGGGNCPAPVAVTVDVFAETKEATITWEPVDNATSYIVEYRKVGAANFISLVANDFTIDVTGLDCPAEYEVRVRAVCGNNSSPFATTTFALNDCGGSFCPIPRNLATIVYQENTTDYVVRVNWRSAAPLGFYYELQYAKANDPYGDILPLMVEPIDDTMFYHISGLVCPENYKFRVRTVCFDMSRSDWATINFSVTQCNQQGDCPAVQNLRVEETTNLTGTISFNRVPEGRDYTVVLRNSFGAEVDRKTVPQSTNASITVLFTGLNPEQDYTAIVTVNCTNGGTSEPRSVVFRTVDCMAPQTFEVGEVSFNTIEVKWDAIPGALGYQVEIKFFEAPNYDGTRLVTINNPNATSYTFTNLEPSRRYEARIRQICARDNFGNPIAFSPWTFTSGNTDDCPSITNAPDVTGVVTTFAVVNWLPVEVSNAKYRVELSTDNGNTYSLYEETENTFSFLQGLTSCTNYLVRVSALCGNSNASSPGVTQFFSTDCNVTCGAVANTRVVSSTANTITVAWNAPTGPGVVEKYFVQYRRVSDATFEPTFPGLDAGTQTTFTIPNLVANQQYIIVVRAKCTKDGNDYSNPDTTFGSTNVIIVDCFPPLSINTEAVGNTIRVNWLSSGGLGYYVTYTPNPTGAYVPNGSVLGKRVVGTSDTITGLASGTYRVSVFTICRDLNGNEFTSAPITSTDIVIPGGGGCQNVSKNSISAPIFQVIGNKVRATLTWGAVAGATGYVVSYSENCSTFQPETTITGTTVTFDNLEPNRQYCWRVKTNCTDGSISSGTDSSFTTPGSSCEAVTSVTFPEGDIKGTSLVVTWTATSIVNQYRIRWRRLKDNNPNQWLGEVTVANSPKQHTIDGLTPGTIYLVEVTSICPTGGGPNGTDPTTSNPVTREVTTAGGVCAVPNVSILSGTITCSNGRIAWTESTLAGEYEVQYKEASATLWSAPTLVSTGTFEFTGLSQLTDYMARVRAVCRSGAEFSDYDVVAFRTPSCIPGEGSTWQITSGGLGWDEAHAVVRSDDGGYVVTGYTYSWGAGEWDVYLAKYNAFGGKMWDKTYGTPNRDEGRAVRQTADGGYIITGYTNGKGGETDIYVIKTDGLGNLQWERSYGASATWEVGYDIRQTVDGGYIIAGTHLQAGAGARDVAMVKIDQDGAIEWQKTYGGTADDYGYSVVQTKDGGYAVGGYTQSVGAGRQDMLVMKTSATGAVLWARALGGSDRDFGYSVAQDTSGNIIVGGYARSFGEVNGDVLVAKFDENGNSNWVKTFGNSTFDFANHLTTLPNGDIVVAGATSGDKTNATFIRLNASGKLLASRTYGDDTGTDQGRQVIPAGDGGFVIAGQSNSTFGGNVPAGKNAEVYLIKADNNGQSCTAYTKAYTGIQENTPTATPADVTTAITNGTQNSAFRITSASGSIVDDPKFKVVTVCAPQTCTDIANLTVNNITGTSAEATWTSTGADFYQVRYRELPAGNFTPQVKTTATTYNLTALKANTDYEVEVVGVCSGSIQSNPAIVQFNTGAVTGCNAPTNITITAVTNSTATVSWSGVQGALGYLVRYRKDEPNATAITISVQPSQGTVTLTNLDTKTRYIIQVGTICSTGSISYSLEYPFVTLRRANDEVNFQNFSLYPNPTKGDLTLNFNATSTEPATIQVVDMTGKVIFTQTVNTTEGNNDVPVDLNGNAAGIYLLRFTQGQQAQTVKVVLQ